MKFGYYDPPYLGCAAKHYDKLHADAARYDSIEAHRDLIDRASSDHPDGWAMSLSTPSLRHILPLCPDDVRIGSWVKPFCSFKPGVTVAYAWEPVIFRGGRKRPRTEPTVRDYVVTEDDSPVVSANILLKKGCPGAKPEKFCFWLFEVLYMQPDDQFDDIFPGSGLVTEAWKKWCDLKVGAR